MAYCQFGSSWIGSGLIYYLQMCVCLDRTRTFCMFFRRQPFLAASQYAVVHDSCPSLLSSSNLTFDHPLSCCATVGAGQDVHEWRALACNVLVIICLSKVACHWAPSRFETYVQQSILLNFQVCQQNDQMCIKMCVEYVFDHNIGRYFLCVVNVFIWLSQGQEVESAAIVKSELLSPVV